MEHPVTSERVTLSIKNEPIHNQMNVYVARPTEPGRYPGMILFMEIFGINSHIRDVAERLAKRGYVVAVPDYFHRTAPGIELNYDQAGMEKGMPLIQKLKRSEILKDVETTISYLRSRKDTTPRLGAIGFCIGGHLAYLTATQFDIAATASFYGAGIAVPGMLGEAGATVDLTPGIAKHHGKVLCFFGGLDAMIPKEQRDRIEHALREVAVHHEVIVYPQATHGFFCDQRGAFHQPSRDDAWERVLKLFQNELKK